MKFIFRNNFGQKYMHNSSSWSLHFSHIWSFSLSWFSSCSWVRGFNRSI